MGLRFRKSIKIAPGFKINISKSGISATVGKRGSSVNIGDKSTYLNLGIPGTGISYRGKISGKTDMSDIPEYESLQSSEEGDYKYTFFMTKINSVGISATVNLKEAGAIATSACFNPTGQDLLLLCSGIIESNTAKILLTNKNIFFASEKAGNIQVSSISLRDIKDVIIKKRFFFSSVTLTLADRVITLDMFSKKASSKFFEYCMVGTHVSEHSNVKDTQMESPSNIAPNIEEMSHIDASEIQETKPSSSILFKLLKFIFCCFFCLIAMFCIFGSMTQGKEWWCFPAGFAVAGSLVAMSAKRKSAEGSTFKWWLYGALVPVVSWIDITMMNSQSKVNGFLKGVAYTVLGFIVFLAVFSNFI